MLADVVSMLYQFGTNAAFLLLSALGLMVILGMMNIINLAHGEFMMLGAYAATSVVHRGVPFPLAVHGRGLRDRDYSGSCWSGW